MLVAVDTSLLVGLFVPDDTWRAQAGELVHSVRQRNASLVYFDCVIAEASSAAVRRLSERRAPQRIAAVLARFRNELPASALTWILPDAKRHYDGILNLMEQTGGTLNFHDALIALACRNRGIQYIASFDQDFDQVTWLTRLASPQDITV